jgi:hypothetical protein
LGRNPVISLRPVAANRRIEGKQPYFPSIALKVAI